MSDPESILAECLDEWMKGGDPAPILQRNPELAEEMLALLDTAMRVRESADGFEVMPDLGRLRATTDRLSERRSEAVLTLLKRILTIQIASR